MPQQFEPSPQDSYPQQQQPPPYGEDVPSAGAYSVAGSGGGDSSVYDPNSYQPGQFAYVPYGGGGQKSTEGKVSLKWPRIT